MSKKINPKLLNPFKDRTPVQRTHAADHLLITLISFVISIGGTRLFLEVTGYPQLGGGNLHIAHVLWGGLFLFTSALLPLILVNQWVYPLSATIAGFGIGLFIDEVGKFITQNNDYFHPTAAPIIYVFFLLTVLLFTQIRKREKHTSREGIYSTLELITEVVDHDLSKEELNIILQKLNEIVATNESIEIVKLAESLKSYLEANVAKVVPDSPSVFDRFRIWLKKVEESLLYKKRLRSMLIIGLLLWGIWALVSPLGYLLVSRDSQQLQIFVDQLITNRLVRNASGLNWFEARVLLEGSTGVVSLLAAFMLALRSQRVGVWVGIGNMLFTLTVVNLLIFYFDQFSTIVIAFFQFILFILLLRYQNRFISKKSATVLNSINKG